MNANVGVVLTNLTPFVGLLCCLPKISHKWTLFLLSGVCGSLCKLVVERINQNTVWRISSWIWPRRWEVPIKVPVSKWRARSLNQWKSGENIFCQDHVTELHYVSWTTITCKYYIHNMFTIAKLAQIIYLLTTKVIGWSQWIGPALHHQSSSLFATLWINLYSVVKCIWLLCLSPELKIHAFLF